MQEPRNLNQNSHKVILGKISNPYNKAIKALEEQVELVVTDLLDTIHEDTSINDGIKVAFFGRVVSKKEPYFDELPEEITEQHFKHIHNLYHNNKVEVHESYAHQKILETFRVTGKLHELAPRKYSDMEARIKTQIEKLINNEIHALLKKHGIEGIKLQMREVRYLSRKLPHHLLGQDTLNILITLGLHYCSNYWAIFELIHAVFTEIIRLIALYGVTESFNLAATEILLSMPISISALFSIVLEINRVTAFYAGVYGISLILLDALPLGLEALYNLYNNNVTQGIIHILKTSVHMLLVGAYLTILAPDPAHFKELFIDPLTFALPILVGYDLFSFLSRCFSEYQSNVGTENRARDIALTRIIDRVKMPFMNRLDNINTRYSLLFANFQPNNFENGHENNGDAVERAPVGLGL